MPRPRATIVPKLIVSHLLIVVIGIATIFIAAQLIAPTFFDRHMQTMGGAGGPGMMGNREQAQTALNDAFRAALLQALLIAGAVAGVLALLASLFVARRIADPVGRMVVATRRVAAGRYTERVAVAPANRGDELGALAASFNTMAETLEQTERRRLELLGDISHELRTPIATLEGYLEGLLDGVVTPRPELWALLHGEAGRLRHLVDDLQELSRAEARQLTLTPRAVAPATLIAATSARLQPQFDEAGLTLRVELPANLPAIYADPDRVNQVLTNLLINALRYTPPPGVVTIGATRAGDGVRFTVADTGIGFDPAEAPRLFERFYRVEKSRARALGGSGIGLTIARALIEAMNGTIAAESAGPGRGSSFHFTLPLAPPHA